MLGTFTVLLNKNRNSIEISREMFCGLLKICENCEVFSLKNFIVHGMHHVCSSGDHEELMMVSCLDTMGVVVSCMNFQFAFVTLTKSDYD